MLFHIAKVRLHDTGNRFQLLVGHTVMTMKTGTLPAGSLTGATIHLFMIWLLTRDEAL